LSKPRSAAKPAPSSNCWRRTNQTCRDLKPSPEAVKSRLRRAGNEVCDRLLAGGYFGDES
jgi:hypothetical protein